MSPASAGVGFANEQPVFLADRRGPNRIFHEVVVDLHAAVGQVSFQRAPLTERIINGGSQRALRELASAGFKFDQGALDTFDDRPTFTGAHGRPQTWAGVVFSQVGFDAVELLDLAQQPARQAR